MSTQCVPFALDWCDVVENPLNPLDEQTLLGDKGARVGAGS